jgi:signal transduction histidine kinase
MYAPSLEIAKWILSRRKIDLIVSSPVLPDGTITRLKDALERMTSPPDLVVVGDLNVASAEQMERSGYQVAALRRIPQNGRPPAPEKLERSIRSLGADLRNDLNNPLQEIVAMVFVAKNGDTSKPAQQALEAIDKAAQNMATVVRSLEDKIMKAVEKLPLGPGQQ